MIIFLPSRRRLFLKCVAQQYIHILMFAKILSQLVVRVKAVWIFLILSKVLPRSYMAVRLSEVKEKSR